MNAPETKLRRRSRRRGQAMVEYSMINWILIVLVLTAGTAPAFPPSAAARGAGDDYKDTNGQRRNLIELFLDAYQTYYDSYYFVLNLPFP